MTKKGVLVFDLDDTLIPSTKIYREIEQDLFGPNIFCLLQGRNKVKERLPSNHVSARNRLLYFKAMIDLHPNLNKSPLTLIDKYEELLHNKVETFSKHKKLSSFLWKLKDNYHLSILTNENLRTQLIKLSGIDSIFYKIFDVIITSEEIGVEKPDEKMFLSIENHFFEFKKSQITMIGDSIDSDILPALQMGWNAFHITEFIEPIPNCHAQNITSLLELERLLTC